MLKYLNYHKHQLYRTLDSKEVSRTRNCTGDAAVADDKGVFDTIESADSTDEKYTTKTLIEWHPIRHPRLPVQVPPRYYVNKLGDVRSNVTGKLRPLKPVKGTNPSYCLGIDKNKRSCFKLEEIMAWTFFAEELASNKIRYLVSNTGHIYSLIKRRHLSPCTNDTGYQTIGLSCDTDNADQVSKKHSFSVHSIVMQSFMKARRAEKLEIDHINAKKQDNSFQNLAYVTKSENIRRIYGPTQTATRNMLKEQGAAPKKYALQPLPPVTQDTEWRPIGTLPWNGLSFNQYEVSDVGHVRKIGESIPLAQRCVNGGYPQSQLPSLKDTASRQIL
ncbi:hypothetical protein BJV82DRAFT_574795 [Fennellomyces sp. T-0311]|nr:hypothetical protein BJV82DRAFT_574795 [Fennellomyces sp. T-0311]